MNIDRSKLKNVVPKKDGKVEAQCPACNAAGHDATGNHLIVFPDGKFGCVVNQGDVGHNKEILDLVGVEEAEEFVPRKATIRPFKAPKSKTVMKVPRRTLEELGFKRGDNPEKEVKK